MNTNTNHLMDTSKMNDDERGLLSALGYEPIPKLLSNAAKVVLKNRADAHVSFQSGGKLATWARTKRKKRNKLTKNSRRSNRK